MKNATLKWLKANPWLTVTLDCTGQWCGVGNTSEVCRFCGTVRDEAPHGRTQAYWDSLCHVKDCLLYDEEESARLYQEGK